MQLHNRIEWLKIFLFLAAIWIPLLLTFTTPLKKISAAEKRELAPFPSISTAELATFPDRFEAFYNDHFGLRNTLVRGYNIMQVSVLGASVSDKVIVGKDGWLFQNGKPHLSDIRNTWPFSEAELRHWANVLIEKHRALEAKGITYLFVISPSKHLIYQDKLPEAFQPVSPVSRMDQLVAYLEQHTDVPVLDLRPGLFKARETLRPYHRTDTHWNAYGAYTGYRQIMDYLKKRKNKGRMLKLKPRDFTVRTGPGGDLAGLLNMRNDLREEYIEPEESVGDCLYNTSLVVEADDPDRQRNRNSFATECSRGTGRLLMFRDSYSLAMMPYLSESFSYVYYFPSSPVSRQGLYQVVEEQRPDIVIEQRTSRWLRTPEG
jgi:hypothetical protein